MLLLAGDLTRHGTADEARCVAQEFGGLAVPVIAILGNHDYHCDQQAEVTKVLEDGGITVLECAGTVLQVGTCASASPGRRDSAAGSRARAPASSASRR